MPRTTPAPDWAPASDVVTLPSGKTAELRQTLPVYALLRSGKLTNDELAALELAAAGSLEDVSLAVRLIDVVCEAMFIDPQVSVDGADGTVPVAHLEQDDQDFVMERAFGGTPGETFRDEPAGDDGGDDGKVLGNKAKRPARRAKRKPSSARS